MLGEPPNYSGNVEWAPTLASDALSIWFGAEILGSSEIIGFASRSDRASPFGAGTALPAPVNVSVEGTPFVSPSGLSLYFYSLRAGGAGARDLYVATRSSGSQDFSNALPLSALNGPSNDHMPWASPDELMLYFVSDRQGSPDIWRATRSSTANPFGSPVRVDDLNTPGIDARPTLSADQRLVIFESNRPGTSGNLDLFQAVRATAGAAFGTPVPIAELNTGFDDANPGLTPDGQELFFISNRGDGSDPQIFRSVRTCP